MEKTGWQYPGKFDRKGNEIHGLYGKMDFRLIRAIYLFGVASFLAEEKSQTIHNYNIRRPILFKPHWLSHIKKS